MEGMFNARPNSYNLRNFQELVTGKKENCQKPTWDYNLLLPLLPEKIELLTFLDNFKKVMKS